MNQVIGVNCGICKQFVQNSKKICRACMKFFYRNRHRNLTEIECQSGTNQCLELVETKSVKISNGATWRMTCKRCRLEKCFEVCSNSSSSIASDSSGQRSNESNEMPVLTKATAEALAMFEMTYFQWIACQDKVLLANMLSATIVQFSKCSRFFAQQPEQSQLRYAYESAPLICLLLSQLSTKVQIDTSFLANIFSNLPPFSIQALLSYELNKFKPSIFEIGLLLEAILCRNLYRSDNFTNFVAHQRSEFFHDLTPDRRMFLLQTLELIENC